MVRTAYPQFWGYNLRYRGYLRLKEIYDCHPKETVSSLFNKERKNH